MAARADKRQAKIPNKAVNRSELAVDPKTGKLTKRLYFEEVDKKKPPSKLSHALRDAPANTVLGAAHREIRKSEDDNVGVESAHRLEETAEDGRAAHPVRPPLPPASALSQGGAGRAQAGKGQCELFISESYAGRSPAFQQSHLPLAAEMGHQEAVRRCQIRRSWRGAGRQYGGQYRKGSKKGRARGQRQDCVCLAA